MTYVYMYVLCIYIYTQSYILFQYIYIYMYIYIYISCLRTLSFTPLPRVRRSTAPAAFGGSLAAPSAVRSAVLCWALISPQLRRLKNSQVRWLHGNINLITYSYNYIYIFIHICFCLYMIDNKPKRIYIYIWRKPNRRYQIWAIYWRFN